MESRMMWTELALIQHTSEVWAGLVEEFSSLLTYQKIELMKVEKKLVLVS